MCDPSFLGRVVTRLERSGVPYMIAGSVASSFYGKPRTTNDIDVVIDPAEGNLDGFLASFGEGYYLSREAAQEALASRSMFNVIDHQTGLKVDFIVRKNRPFSAEEFSRRKAEELEDPPVTVFLASPEDVILSKLEWCNAGESERQFSDAVSVASVCHVELDRDYLQRWARELQVDGLLDRLFRELS